MATVAMKGVPMRKDTGSRVQQEIGQRAAFHSTGQEATVALLRTASVVRRALSRVIEPSGLSLAQYNALRIIRGAGSAGIATLAIRARMIEEGTTSTRLLNELDPLVDAADADVMSALSDSQQKQFIRLLDRVREANSERGAPRTMTR